ETVAAGKLVHRLENEDAWDRKNYPEQSFRGKVVQTRPGKPEPAESRARPVCSFSRPVAGIVSHLGTPPAQAAECLRSGRGKSFLSLQNSGERHKAAGQPQTRGKDRFIGPFGQRLSNYTRPSPFDRRRGGGSAAAFPRPQAQRKT